MNITVQVTSYHASRRAIHAVRDTVFGDEQEVPRKLDWDGQDPQCAHVLATDEDGHPAGAGRMAADGRIGRVAVLRKWRGKGVGMRIVLALAGAARERGLGRVYLHSQLGAVDFYRKCGFKPEGEPFVEAGISHVTMVLPLQQ